MMHSYVVDLQAWIVRERRIRVSILGGVSTNASETPFVLFLVQSLGCDPRKNVIIRAILHHCIFGQRWQELSECVGVAIICVRITSSATWNAFRVIHAARLDTCIGH